MKRAPPGVWRRVAALAVAALVASCTSSPPNGPGLRVAAADEAAQIRWLDRVSWGANASGARALKAAGLAPWLQAQLRPPDGPAPLPAAAQAQIDAMRIASTPVQTLVLALDAQRKANEALTDDAQKTAARRAYQQRLNDLARETQRRFVLRALYSPRQLHEQMAWFWANHFNVSVRKGELHVLIADYEDQAIRPHALGRFRDLLGATLRHPAMLRYLDNVQNAAGRVNENYARELMELHTLGADGGYSQGDVQELARVLTGIGVTTAAPDAPPPAIAPARKADYVRAGLFEFNPARHDYGPKTLLGRPMTQRGLAEADEALDRLARAPATARFVSNKIAVHFVADAPPRALVDRMADVFQRSDGDIAAVLAAMFESPEFAASLGGKFRDPIHYAIGSVRLAYDDRVASNVNPLIDWIWRMGESIYGHETPDGYPLTQEAWASPGQMTIRFEIARALGANGAVLFRTDDKAPLEKPAFPPLAASPVVRAGLPGLGAATREALAQAASPPDWNTFLLASPEHMHR